ncbi:hypothetical protein CHS0354_010124, partial [Potamilus streckersoni]
KKKQQDQNENIQKTFIDITKPPIEITSELQLDPQTILEPPPPLSSLPSEKPKRRPRGLAGLAEEDREMERIRENHREREKDENS